jgi:hypothetical protein
MFLTSSAVTTSFSETLQNSAIFCNKIRWNEAARSPDAPARVGCALGTRQMAGLVHNGFRKRTFFIFSNIFG